MGEMMCPKCGAKLNEEEQKKGKCSLCGATFEGVPEEKSEEVVNPKKNNISMCLKVLGIIYFVLGTLGSIVAACNNALVYDANYIIRDSVQFSFGKFFANELNVCILSGVLLGFSEIIRLLQEIRDK